MVAESGSWRGEALKLKIGFREVAKFIVAFEKTRLAIESIAKYSLANRMMRRIVAIENSNDPNVGS